MLHISVDFHHAWELPGQYDSGQREDSLVGLSKIEPHFGEAEFHAIQTRPLGSRAPRPTLGAAAPVKSSPLDQAHWQVLYKALSVFHE